MKNFKSKLLNSSKTKCYNQKSKEKGQLLMELLVAMGVLVLAVAAITWLILDVYLADRAGRERTIATFLAEEGMEAARSIRDNSWDDLANGEHGLALLGNNWIFQGNQEDVSNYLGGGVRKIIVEEIDSDRKKITSQVIWEPSEARSQNVGLITYLTNWRVPQAEQTCEASCQREGYVKGRCRPAPACPDLDELGGLGEYGCPAWQLCCCR